MRVPTHLETPENEVTSVPGVSKRQKTRSPRFQAFPNARKRDPLASRRSQTPENEITSVPGVPKRQKTRSPRFRVFPNARKRDHLGCRCFQTPGNEITSVPGVPKRHEDEITSVPGVSKRQGHGALEDETAAVPRGTAREGGQAARPRRRDWTATAIASTGSPLEGACKTRPAPSGDPAVLLPYLSLGWRRAAPRLPDHRALL